MTDSISSANSIRFTKEELKQLQALEITIDTLSKMLMDKTNNRYAIVQRKMVEDINKRLWDNILHGAKINEAISDNWEHFIRDNNEVLDKWEKELRDFKKVEI